MTDHDNPLLRDILDRASELPPHDRAAYLDSACANNPNLRAEVEALLLALDNADDLLRDPTFDREAIPPTIMDAARRPHHESPGSRIGRYKLLQLIGEGGFGSVFMAEQETPLIRKVALKIIKLGMDTRQVIARFEAERQALAMMDHPNIARVLDAGSTDTGRPYFVMELVKGVPITTFCDANKLTTGQRLELFIQVCSALQHAHQKGIIHRDLKPSNVLVTMHDDKPVPKIIDFGVAKALNQRLTEHTLFTEFRQLIGTPVYMSPEQAQMSGLDVDTRSDIYSLGVLLYELLTGTTPFDPKQLRSAAYEEMRRIIREVDPPKPSTRLSTLATGAQSAVADHRRCDPATLGRMLQGDLDWILMKCLEKDRARRYESASALARDIQRHLADEPVEASPPSTTYRLRKLARKHKREAIALTAIFATLLLGITGTTIGLARAQINLAAARSAELHAQNEKNLATANEAKALAAQQLEASERKQAEAVAELLQSVFRGISPFDVAPKSGDLRQDLIARIDDIASTLDKEYVSQPRVAENFERLYGPDHLNALVATQSLALDYLRADRNTEAVAAYERIRQVYLKKLPPEHPWIATCLSGLAKGYYLAGRYGEAIKVLEQFRDLRTQKLGPDDPRAIWAIDGLILLYRKTDRVAEAETLSREVLPHRLPAATREIEDNPADPSPRLSRGWLYKRLGKPREADSDFTKAIELTSEQIHQTSGTPDAAQAFEDRARILARLGRFQDAANDYRKAVELDPENHLYWHDGLVPFLLQAGDVDGYRHWRSLELHRFRFTDDDEVPHRVSKDAFMMPIEGEDLKIALELAERGTKMHYWEPGFGKQTKGMAQYRSGRFREAIPWLTGADQPRIDLTIRTTDMLFLAMAHERSGNHIEARALLQQATHNLNGFPTPGNDDMAKAWPISDWIACQAARREAEQLINGKATTQPAPSTQPVATN